MEFSSKSFVKSGSTSCAYVGILTTGEPIIFVSGIVDQSDCDWALSELEELIAGGETDIVMDYSGVTYSSRQWLVVETRRCQSLNKDVNIRIRDTATLSPAYVDSERRSRQADFNRILVPNV